MLCRHRHHSEHQASTSVAESSTWLTDAERLAQAEERSGNVCSSSSSPTSTPSNNRTKRWRDTGIELAGIFSRRKDEVKEMTASEAMKYYNKEYGDDPLYGDLFRKSFISPLLQALILSI